MRLKNGRLATLSCVVVALCAATAANASASGFTASTTGPLKGHGVGSQVFTNNTGTFTCAGAALTGAMTQLVSPTLKITVQYQNCTWFGFAAVTSPAEYMLHANGEVDLLSNYTFTPMMAGCKMTVLAQNGLKTVSFENQSGKLLIRNHFSGGNYTTTGGLCGAGGKNLTQTGNSEVELEGGTLTFSP